MKKIALLLFIASLSAQSLDTLKIKTEADSLFTVAVSLQKAWQLDEALEFHQNALTKYQQIGDRVKEAKVLYRIGEIYFDNSNPNEALKYWGKELTIHREIGDRKSEGVTLGHIGTVYHSLSDYPQALEYYEKGLEIKREVGFRRSEGATLTNIGLVYSELSDYPQALEYFEKGLGIMREVGDRTSEGIILGNIGGTYWALYDILQALEYFEKSLEIASDLGDRRREVNALISIGAVYHNPLDYPKALEYYEKSLEISREIGYRRMVGSVLNNIGLVYSELSDYPKALEYFEKSLEIASDLGVRALEGNTLSGIGSIYCLQERYVEAEEYIKEALTIAQELKNENRIKACYWYLGDCYAAQSLDLLAVENYVLSIETAEDIRGKLEVEEQKTSYSAGVSELYSKIILSLIKLERYDDAFNYVERGRSRSFLDLLASGDVKVGKSSHKEFLEKEEEFQEKEEAIEEELIAAEEDTVLYASLRGKLEEQRGLIAVEMKEKKEYEPELASLVTVNSLSLSEVQALLDKETILEYFLTDEKTFIWLITKDNAEVFQFDIGGDSLKTLVEDFRSGIMKFSDVEELSSILYSFLIAPVNKKIETEQLVIIPHGILHYLPFHALQDEKGKYLLEKHQISYLPSASVMKYLIPKKRDKGKTILALGNPKLNNTSYPPIPFAEKEVEVISKQYLKSKVLTGAEATEEKFRELAPDYDILHLACHAELNSAYPLFSGLLLSSSEELDGEMDVHELFTMDLNAYLVVLSACQTGLGHLTNGDELVGLSRAFIYAGTPTIISSLWMVVDESTSFLMERFYTYLQKNDKANSLRMAQLDTKEKYKHPIFWAPFVLIGDSN